MWYPFLLHPTPRTNLNLHQQRMLPHTFQPFFSVEKVGRLTDRQMQTKGNQKSSVKLSSQMNYKYIPILFIFFWKNMMHCDTLFLHNTRPHCMLVFRHWPALPFVQRPHWSACQTQTWCLGSVSLLCSQYQCGALASTDKVCQSAKPSQDKNIKIISLIKNVPFIFLCEILYLFMLCH